VSDTTYEDFFNLIKDFKKKQDKQKRRGLNDYNLLTTVLEAHDEVRLHSRMIGSLLNPDGLHYQGALFLEKFLDVLKLDNFDMDLDKIYVAIEYHNIDLYITDGTKHIIVENKIWAADQPCQIIKYINIIKEENNLTIDENRIIDDMRVVYLTPQNKPVSDEHEIADNYISYSGGEEKLKECSKRDNTNELVPDGLKNYKVAFKKIEYKEEILSWLQECLNEIQNITNLNEAIRQYIDVVKIINGNYKGKVMLLEDYLNDENKKLTLKEIYSYLDEIDEMQEKVSEIFIKELEKKLEIYKPKYYRDCLDITINNYLVRFLLADSFKIQITDAVNPFQVVPNEIKKENILTGLKKIDSYFGPGWEKSYATLDLGKVKIQTHKSILEKNFKYMDDIKKCLENN